MNPRRFRTSRWIIMYAFVKTQRNGQLFLRKTTKRPRGLVGLVNTGIKCALNSIVQCFLNTPELRNYFLRLAQGIGKPTVKECDRDSSSLRMVKGFAILIERLYNTGQRCFTPVAFWEAVELHSVVRHRQHDFFDDDNQPCAMDFLTFLINAMFEEEENGQLSTLASVGVGGPSDDIRRLLSMESRAMVTSDECDFLSHGPIEKHWDIGIGVPLQISSSGLQLTDLLKSYVQSGRLKCIVCKQEKAATMRLSTCPQVLIFRLDWLHPSGKASGWLRFPLSGLKLENTMSKEPAVYELWALAEHWGSGRSGHYVAYAKNQDTMLWYKLNDTCVRQVSPNQVTAYHREGAAEGNPVLLFYSLSTPAAVPTESARTDEGPSYGDPVNMALRQKIIMRLDQLMDDRKSLKALEKMATDNVVSNIQRKMLQIWEERKVLLDNLAEVSGDTDEKLKAEEAIKNKQQTLDELFREQRDLFDNLAEGSMETTEEV
ncbi:uncharacterized protein LOC130905300 isoform X2 [Corythoichthys intestinalis]|uniref:uncharacterized protein LOC130905300 isoform X2 n=1 Tax=Corythoichthys intestinalis TaxID=161448 RepID=UPI0025A68B7E|nr:uncharacterized protein LOC130905300 isoform X2 [Corythoichthys intestinalis]